MYRMWAEKNNFKLMLPEDSQKRQEDAKARDLMMMTATKFMFKLLLTFTLVQLNIFALTSPGSSLSRAWPSFDNGPKLGFVYDKA
jgi:hypothetical protein